MFYAREFYGMLGKLWEEVRAEAGSSFRGLTAAEADEIDRVWLDGAKPTGFRRTY